MKRKYKCDIKVSNKDKIKSLNDFNIIHSKYSSFKNIYKLNSEKSSYDIFNENIEVGKEIYWENYRAKIVTSENSKRATVLGFIIHIEFSKDFLLDNMDRPDVIQKFIDSNNEFIKKYFTVIEGFQDNQNLYYLCSANLKYCFWMEKIKEQERKRRSFKDLENILSFNLIFPTSYTNTRGSKISDKSKATSNLQMLYKKEVATPSGFAKEIRESFDRLSKVTKDDYEKDIEKLQTLLRNHKSEIKYLNDKNRILLSEMEEVRKKAQKVIVNEHANKEFEKLTEENYKLARFLKNSNINYNDVINEKIQRAYLIDENKQNTPNETNHKLKHNYELLINTLNVISANQMNWEYLITDTYDSLDQYNPTNLRIIDKDTLMKLGESNAK